MGYRSNANFYRMLNGATEFNLKYTTTYDGPPDSASVPIIVSDLTITAAVEACLTEAPMMVFAWHTDW